jgi:flagellar assembly protein FliH
MSTSAAVRHTARQAGTPHSSAELQELREKVETLTAMQERVARESHLNGFQAGETAARKRVDADFGSVISELAATIEKIASERNGTIQRAEADTVRLAVEIARRVLHREITTDQMALSALVSAALEKLKNQELYRVRLHPDIEKAVRFSLEKAGRSPNIELAVDSALPPGTLHFEISRGSLDASVETQLREIERGLADELRFRS